MPPKRSFQHESASSPAGDSPTKKLRMLDTMARPFFDEDAYMERKELLRRHEQMRDYHNRSFNDYHLLNFGRGPADTPPLSHISSFTTKSRESSSFTDLLKDRQTPYGKNRTEINDNAIKTSASSSRKATSTEHQSTTSQSLGNVVERVLGKYLEELSTDTEHWTKLCLHRARLSTFEEPAVLASHDKPYSFQQFKPIQFVRTLKTAPTSKSHATFTHERAKQKIALSAPITLFTTRDTMPEYAHYVNVKNDFLASNEPTLRCWPYFHDDFDMETMADNLRSQYHIDIYQRPLKVVRLLQAEKFETYVESALDDLAICWADVLTFLLDGSCDIGNDQDALTAKSKRREYCEEDFPSRASTRSVTVLSSLPPTSTDSLAKAACLCENFQRMARFPLWHVARRHLFAYMPVPEAETGVLAERLTCKICKRFECAYHGQINQYEDSDSENDEQNSDKVDSAVEEDIINPPKRNFRTRVCFGVHPETTTIDVLASTHAESTKRAGGHGQSQFVWEPDRRKPFYPCHHPGKTCEDAANCSCFAQKIHCEKICNCDQGCSRRWAGCNCASERVTNGVRTMCFADDRCACFKHSRECDPDLCSSCRVQEVLDPLNRYDDGILNGRCRNASVQRSVPKHTALGQSNIHGFGLYAGKDVRPHEFVGEYKGEIITNHEAERRGAVYEHQKLSYLFSLNQTQEIDSTYFGNKIRFINHAHESRANLYPRIVLVNSVHRIALYASRQIRKGSELFFDYGPKFPTDQLGGAASENKKSNAAPRVRNSKVVLEDFHDIEVTEDEHGNRRARKAAIKSRGGKGPNISAARRKRTLIEDDDDENGEGLDAVTPDRTDTVDDELYFAYDTAEQRLAAYNISDEDPPTNTEPENRATSIQEIESDDYQQDDESLEDEIEESYFSRPRRPEGRTSRKIASRRI